METTKRIKTMRLKLKSWIYAVLQLVQRVGSGGGEKGAGGNHMAVRLGTDPHH